MLYATDIKKGKYWYRKDDEGESLIILEALNNDDVEFINENKINKFVFDNRNNEFHSFDFMLNINEVIALSFTGSMDLNILYKLNDLIYLGLGKQSEIINLSYFQKLQKLYVESPNNTIGIESLINLRSLWAWFSL